MKRFSENNSNPRCSKRRSNVDNSREQNGDGLGSTFFPTDIPMSYKCSEIIKSPLDGKRYLAVEFDNGLQCVLISTYPCNNDIDYCLPLEPTTCSFQEVYEFNKCFLQMYNDQGHDKDPDEMSLLGKIAAYTSKNSVDTIPETKLEEKELWEPPRKKSFIKCPVVANSYEPFAISIAIAVGCLNDPDNISGIAHLLEHVVFLGTQGCPEPWTILSNNTISANAATEMDHTIFHAAMNTSTEFVKVMELFSEMVACPKLSQEHVENEVHNIDCENTIKLSRDFLRVGALFLLCSRSDHRMRRFGMGDRISLGRCDITQLVRKHFHRYYRPNYMTLCIQAPLPMEDLIRLSAQHFQKLEYMDQPKPWEEIVNEGFPFDQKKFSRMYKVYPFKNVQWMIVSWAMSCLSWQNYETKPLEYAAMLLSHKGKSGLDFYLKSKGWITCSATSFSSECQEQDAYFLSNKYYSGIHLGLELTNEGVLQETEIIKAIFSYIALLRQVGPKRRIFNELRTAKANRYHYRTCMDKSVIDIGIAACRPRSPKLILTGPELLTTYDPDAIRDVLDSLLPRETNVITVSRMFKNIVTTIDPVSLVTYGSHPFCPDLLDELESIKPFREFTIPDSNPYVCNNICRPVDFDIGGMTVETSLSYLRLSGKAGLKHQHTSSKRGLADYSVYTFEFTSPYCRANPHNCAMICLWKKMLKEKILTRIHPAVLADVTFSIFDGESGLLLSLDGPSVFLPTVWLDVLDEFMNFENYLEEKTFLTFKELHLKIFQNANLRYDTLGYAEDLVLYLTTYQYILMSVLENYLRYYVTFDEFLQFTRNYKSRMWICSELLGTITYSELGLLAGSLTRLEYDALPEGDICVNHVQQLPIGEKCLSVKAMSKACITSTTWNYYQLGQLTEDMEDMLPILAKHISNFLFNQLRSNSRVAPVTKLRTKEQLSYFVKVESDISFTVSSISVIVIMQADRFKPGYVDERIDNSLVSFYNEHMKTEEKVRNLFQLASNSTEAGSIVKEFLADSKFIKKLRYLYKKCLPHKILKVCKRPSYRKLTVQVQGNPRFEGSIPLEPVYRCPKRKVYETPQTQINPDCIQRAQGKIILEIPDDLVHENAYFITSLDKFKQSLKMYPNDSDYKE
ncbi:unnamed protein product [Allacma fusca]|uniref:Nardilysin n=1 Tax=Allacma fusca TaxID=39272 RepID=A0A8J2KB01_9HEXA|nr:unnamed protein product [Allacma fusca]